MGQSPLSKYYNDSGVGLPFLQGNRTFGPLYPTVDTWTRKATRLALPNDILMSVRAPVGALNIANKEVCIGRGLCSLRAKNEQHKFLYYLLKNSVVRLVNKESGTVFGSVNKKDIETLKVAIPSVKTQQSISNILSCLDKKIELNNKINENLEQQAQVIFKSWFVDFEPFQDGKFVESELGMIPNGWKVARLPEFVEVTYGSAFQSKYFNKEKKGFPLLRIRDLKTRNPQIYTEQELGNQTIIEAGDLVAGMDAEFIPYIWLGEKALMNQRVCRFKYKDKTISNLYTYYLLKPSLEYIQNYKTGTTVSHIGKRDIDNIAIIVPPTSILHDFSNIVKPILNYKIALANQIRTLTNLRDTLLPKLMSGEIEVPVE